MMRELVSLYLPGYPAVLVFMLRRRATPMPSTHTK